MMLNRVSEQGRIDRTHLWRGLVVLFVLGCWWQLLAPTGTVVRQSSADDVASRPSTQQPLKLPTSLHASWVLGRCAAQVESQSELEVNKALTEASQILKTSVLTPDAIARIGLALKEQDARSALLTAAVDMTVCIDA